MKLKPIDHTDFKDLKPFFKSQVHALCAYSLPSVLVWQNELYHPRAVVEDGFLVVGAEFTARPECRHLLLPLCPGRLPTVDELVDIAGRSGFGRYQFVPGAYLRAQDPETVARWFVVTEQSNFHDYIYRRDDLAKLKGNKYAKKRNLIHQFERNYPEPEQVRVESITPATADECIDFLEKWCLEQGCDRHQDEELYCEEKALQNAIHHMQALEMRGVLFRVDGIVSALGVAAHLTADMGALHFEKAFSNIKGLYQYVDRECARRLFNGYDYINKESDMGLEGLAKAKKSYHPVDLVKSYRLDLRSTP